MKLVGIVYKIGLKLARISAWVVVVYVDTFEQCVCYICFAAFTWKAQIMMNILIFQVWSGRIIVNMYAPIVPEREMKFGNHMERIRNWWLR